VRKGRHEKGNPQFGLNSIAKKVDYLDMHVRSFKVARNAELALLRLEVAESSLNGFLHVPEIPPANFSFPVPLDTETSKRYKPTVPSDVTPAV
jgi:hypothetical protein